MLLFLIQLKLQHLKYEYIYGKYKVRPIKDLKIIHKDLSSVVIIDDKPNNYRNYPGLFVYLIRIFNKTL